MPPRVGWLCAALPVFLLGSVAVLIAYQIRLGFLQAAHTDFDDDRASASSASTSGGSTDIGSLHSTAAAAAALAAAHGGPAHPQQQQHPQQQPVVRDTLVVYVFNEDDPAFTDNFHYFLLAGVQQDSRCAYVVIVHERALKSSEELPAVPGVRYLYYGGPCSEWGMLGWMLASGLVDWAPYRFFVLLSSAVRGPFMPTYLHGAMHWTAPLLSRLNERVKLVGPVITCGGPPTRHDGEVDAAAASTASAQPHMPFHALATDRAGLDVLVRAGVTRCPAAEDASHHMQLSAEQQHASDVKAAAAIFEAGFTIDCLLIRYQGVDWRAASAAGCNRGWDPSGPGDAAYDGTYLDPMEVVFAVVNSPMLAARAPAALKAAKYAAWATDVVAEAVGTHHNRTGRVAGNAFAANKGLYKLPRILMAVVRGSACFDAAHFIDHNRDLFGPTRRDRIDEQLAWRFFVYIAQFEDRPFRYTCAFNYSGIALPAF